MEHTKISLEETFMGLRNLISIGNTIAAQQLSFVCEHYNTTEGERWYNIVKETLYTQSLKK